MKNRKRMPIPGAMAFYHQDGFVAAWQQAKKFAGKDGRLSTMLDIVAAWLATKPGEVPWETYFTTLTAEYFGFSRQGNHILIDAHGIGPLSTLEGIKKAYSWEYKDKERNRHGGRITQQEFWDLEAGKFGEVSIVDFEAYCRRYQYPFMQFLRSSEALTDPLLKARLGEDAEQYVLAHTKYARQWHQKQAGLQPENTYHIAEDTHLRYLTRRIQQHLRDSAKDSDPYIVRLEDASNWCYTFGPEHGHREIEDGLAIVHLISTGCLCETHHEGNESLTLDVGCHEWLDGVRLVAIKAGTSIRSGLHQGPDIHKLIQEHWQDLLVPVSHLETVGFRALMPIAKQWFTQLPKKGDGLATWEPEYVVTSLKKIGKPVLFKTEVLGYHGFFKYSEKAVHTLAPNGANAYFFVSEPKNEWHDGNPTHQTAMVQFYHVKADTSRRMIRDAELCHDYEKIMELLEKEVA